MATYAGPATLVLPDGREVEVRATLTFYVDHWNGTVTVLDTSESIFNDMAATCTLRLVDGKTAEVVLGTVGGVPPVEVAEVRGSGPAPF